MRRLSLSLLIVVLIATIGLGWVIDRLFASFGENETDYLQVYLQLGNNLVVSSNTGTNVAELIRSWPESGQLQLKVLAAQELALPDELQQQMQGGEPLVVESDETVTLFFALDNGNQVLSITPPPAQTQTRLRLLLTLLFYGGVNVLILLWIYPLARRLHALGSAARAFGEGKLDKRVATSKRSYLRDIESEFNNMAQRIQGLVADNEMLASAVAHDLRTPLARLRFGVDLLDEATDEATRAKYQERISNDLTAMENLVNVLLEYARLDRQLSDMPKNATDLNSLVSACLDSLVDVPGKSIRWLPDSTAPQCMAHARYATMLVNNLLQNAVNYSHSIVQVSTRKTRNGVLLVIEDDGPGIPLEKRQDVLKPFVRGQAGMDETNRKGYGMGLAIVTRIAEWHGAGFSIGQSSDLGGARFDVSFIVSRNQ